MQGSCSIHRETRNAYKAVAGKPHGRERLGSLGMDRCTIWNGL